MAEAELSPCPFCGGDARIISHHHTDAVERNPDGSFKMGLVEYFMARCSECGASTDYSDVKNEAIVFWNHRASDSIEKDALRASLLKEELEGILDDLERLSKMG